MAEIKFEIIKELGIVVMAQRLGKRSKFCKLE